MGRGIVHLKAKILSLVMHQDIPNMLLIVFLSLLELDRHGQYECLMEKQKRKSLLLCPSEQKTAYKPRKSKK